MPDSYSNVYALILAAGGSTRMGRPKQLLRWQDRTLLERAVDSARWLLHERVIVVLGANAELIRSTIDFHAVDTMLNSEWATGLASSIRQGMKALPPTAEAVLVMLCDQPLVDSAHLEILLNSWQSEPGRIVASQYHLSSGVPVVFPSAYFGRLRSLTGDKGAKALLAEFDSYVLKIPFAGAGLDIDTPADFEQLTGQAFAEE
jgi:molybdenum cofactor cytidylyltransferase